MCTKMLGVAEEDSSKIAVVVVAVVVVLNEVSFHLSAKE